MRVSDIAKIIYVEDTASEDTDVTISTINDPHDIICRCKAKELKNIKECGRLKNIQKWSVCEMKRHKDLTGKIPIYNRGIHLTIY